MASQISIYHRTRHLTVTGHNIIGIPYYRHYKIRKKAAPVRFSHRKAVYLPEHNKCFNDYG